MASTKSTALPGRLLYVGGHQLLRDALAAALGRYGIVVVPAVSVQEALERIEEESLDAALLDDEGLGDAGTLEALSTLLSKSPGLKVGLISGSRSPVFPADALRAGAAAYLSKETPVVELRFALERMLQGQLVVDPIVTRTLFGLLGPGVVESAVRNGEGRLYLTAAERKVLSLAADGKANKQIGAHLGVSPLTVKNHLARIRSRFGAADKAQAVAVAIRSGLLD